MFLLYIASEIGIETIYKQMSKSSWDFEIYIDEESCMCNFMYVGNLCMSTPVSILSHVML